VDTSALVKLVVREAESDALEDALSTWRGLATSSITTIELQRAAQRARADDREGVAGDETIAVLLAAVAQIPLSPLVRQTAATLHPVELRTLDAIHLASALALGNDLADCGHVRPAHGGRRECTRTTGRCSSLNRARLRPYVLAAQERVSALRDR
jgi:predicted nucleic acid-binding protein